jgi:hypothetical protein
MRSVLLLSAALIGAPCIYFGAMHLTSDLLLPIVGVDLQI